MNRLRTTTMGALIACAALAFGAGQALAQGPGGGGGGGGGGGHGGGGHFGGRHGGYGGYRGGYRGGYGGYGGYGWRGGYGGYGGYGYGWRGGYGGYAGYGWGGWGYPWGWGGLGVGLYFDTLPLYYSTYWANGVPYYYADDTFYTWNGDVGQYETVTPPQEVANEAGGASEGEQEADQPADGGGTPAQGGAPAGDLMVYPKNGQNDQQLSTDRYECHHWAVGQSGFDPTQGYSATATPQKRFDYRRAQAACLEGRGYTVK